MAQISTTSTGTTLSGGDGSGTHSGIMSVLGAIRYLKLLQALNGSRNVQGGREPKSEEPKETSEGEKNDPIAVEVETEPQKALEGRDQNAIEGEEPKLLSSAPDKLVPQNPPVFPLKTAASQMMKDDDLIAKVRVGEFYVKDAYPQIERHLESMSKEQREALTTAMNGGYSRLPVDIEVTDKLERNIRFASGPAQNRGWNIESGSSSLNIPAEQVEKQSTFQRSPDADRIRELSSEIFEGNGPHIIEGKETGLRILVADNLVVVVDGQTNRVLDSVEISQKTGEVKSIYDEINGRTADDQAKEALADFGHLVTQAKTTSAASKGKQKQREL